MTELTLDELTDIFRNETEDLFGKPTNDWNYTGIVFLEGGPSLIYYPDEGEVKISLSPRATEQFHTLIFQLTHEVCHLLHPKMEYPSLFENKITVINEGLSTFYCVEKMHEYCQLKEVTINSLKENDPKYYVAFNLVNELMQIDPNSIKKLREVSPRIDKLKIEDFDTLGFEIDLIKKQNLLSQF